MEKIAIPGRFGVAILLTQIFVTAQFDTSENILFDTSKMPILCTVQICGYLLLLKNVGCSFLVHNNPAILKYSLTQANF